MLTWQSLVNSLNVRAGCQGNQLCDLSIGNFRHISISTLDCGGRWVERDWRSRSIANSQWPNLLCQCQEVSIRSQKNDVHTDSALANMSKFEESGTPKEDLGASTPFLTCLFLCICFIWLLRIKVFLSSVCWSFKALKPKEGDLGTCCLVALWSGSQVTTWTYNGHLKWRQGER